MPQYLIQAVAGGTSNDIQQSSPDRGGELMQHSQGPHQHGGLLGPQHRPLRPALAQNALDLHPREAHLMHPDMLLLQQA